jgi:hypothetical protein
MFIANLSQEWEQEIERVCDRTDMSFEELIVFLMKRYVEEIEDIEDIKTIEEYESRDNVEERYVSQKELEAND